MPVDGSSVRGAKPKLGMRELVVYFLRLGLMGFGGPVALVGQMEKELVGDRKWLTREQMREAVAVCQSLPGPLAIQVGIFIAYLRGGFWGAWAGGWAFILPNFVIVAALGALYVYLGDLKPVTAIFYGVSPAVIALILHSSYRLAKLGMEDWLQWLIAATCAVPCCSSLPARLACSTTGRCSRAADGRHRPCSQAYLSPPRKPPASWYRLAWRAPRYSRSSGYSSSRPVP
jgi:chromate transport protein ChrA